MNTYTQEVIKTYTDVLLTVETKKDDLGRVRILSQWKADNIGRKLNETGMRGQYSLCTIEDCINRWLNKSFTVFITVK